MQGKPYHMQSSMPFVVSIQLGSVVVGEASAATREIVCAFIGSSKALHPIL